MHLEAGMEVETTEGEVLSMTWPACLLILPRTYCTSVVLPTVSCVLQHQLLIKNMLTNLLTGQPDGGISRLRFLHPREA